MHSDDSLFALFDDLEQQAAGLHLAEREAEVEELAMAEYAQVTLEERLHGARGAAVRLRLVDGNLLNGTLRRVGRDWLQVDDPHGCSWMVRTAAVAAVSGLGARAVNEDALPVTARLSLRSALRALAEARGECVLHLVGGDRVEGIPGRVGQDFVEVIPTDPASPRAAGRRAGGRAVEVVPLSGLVSVRERR
jgi:hypothetical protein